MAALTIVRPGRADRPACQSARSIGSFEQEHREILQSVMGALSSSVPDPDEMAACSYLLRHLAGIMGSHEA